MLRLNKDETSPELLDPDPRLREDVLALKRLTASEKPEITRCRASELMTAFYLIEDASGKGFGLGLWDHEGLRYYSANWSTQRKNGTSKWKEGTNITVRFKELAEEQKLDNRELFILTDKQVFER